MDKRKNVSKAKSLFIAELENPPAMAAGEATTLALGEEAGSYPIFAAICEYIEEKKL